MAEGIRLRHPVLKDCVYTVEHPRPYIVPLLCGVCGHPHVRKTYHLRIASDGTTIVSQTVYERLREIGLADLELINLVSNPPALVVGGALPSRLPRIAKGNPHG